MTYLQHLEEFRRRIIVCFVALVAAVAVCWFFAWDILHVLERPAGHIVLHYMKPMEPFLVRFKLALYVGVLLALPVICLLYTSDAADDLLCVDLGGRRIIKKK